MNMLRKIEKTHALFESSACDTVSECENEEAFESMTDIAKDLNDKIEKIEKATKDDYKDNFEKLFEEFTKICDEDDGISCIDFEEKGFLHRLLDFAKNTAYTLDDIQKNLE